MSNPENGAARNTMSEFERQCYDWGWADSKERIIKLLVEADTTHLNAEGLKGWYFALGLIEGETDE